jgi:mono/diheme cytochrome c family protein
MANLDRKLILCLILMLAVIVFIPVYLIREPGRQADAIARIQKENVQKGNDAFLTACASCHGKQAQGAVGPALVGKGATLVQKTVRSGRGIMPAFSVNLLSDEDLTDMTLYLASLSPTTAPVATAKPPSPTSGTVPSSPSVTAKPTAPATSTAPADPVAQGKELFETRAGGVGCAGCHGADASGAFGPNIRGATAQQITTALNKVQAMTFMKLTNDEINALAAYLKTLPPK